MTWRHRELATPNLCACGSVDLPTSDAQVDDGVAVHGYGACNSHGQVVTR